MFNNNKNRQCINLIFIDQKRRYHDASTRDKAIILGQLQLPIKVEIVLQQRSNGINYNQTEICDFSY